MEKDAGGEGEGKGRRRERGTEGARRIHIIIIITIHCCVVIGKGREIERENRLNRRPPRGPSRLLPFPPSSLASARADEQTNVKP